MRVNYNKIYRNIISMHLEKAKWSVMLVHSRVCESAGDTFLKFPSGSIKFLSIHLSIFVYRSVSIC